MEKSYIKNKNDKCKHKWAYGHSEQESPAGKYWDSYKVCELCGQKEGILHNRFFHNS